FRPCHGTTPSLAERGFPVSKPADVSQLEQGEDPWVLGLQGSEEREVQGGACQGRNQFNKLKTSWCLKKRAGIPSKDLVNSKFRVVPSM
uniref:KRAB domain-containing protein n=1 Tax=Gopherus evgoodei TaxID=1825980 RepID=A0A8C4YKW8_9SAUR